VRGIEALLVQERGAALITGLAQAHLGR